jgi:plastocyanin
VDESSAAAARKIVWDFSVSSAANRCMIVKKGQQVAFEGSLITHPLIAMGGNGPNPFSSVPDTGKVTFTGVGTFGFACSLHPAMLGAIRVIE